MGRSDPAARDTSIPRAPVAWWIVALLLVLGVQLWFLVDERLVRGGWELILPGAAVVLSFLPPVQRRIAAVTGWLQARQGGWVVAIALLIWAGSCVYFYQAATRQRRVFEPFFHDEHSYQLQATLLAEGRLWMPRHLLGDFFDSFYVITDPVYASKYFPGTAMLLAPGVWLGAPRWLAPLVLSGATVMLAYLVFRELLGGAAGVLAALMFPGISLLRMLSIMSLSAVPALLLGMLAIWGWLRWRRSRGRSGWLVLLGISAGWLIITRPLDAVCFLAPLLLVMLLELWHEPWRRKLRTGAIVGIAALPLVAVQLVFNKGVTGHWLTSPFAHYNARDFPNVRFGFHTFDPAARPASVVPQKQAYYRQTVRPMLEEHTPAKVAHDWIARRLPWFGQEALPESLLMILIPLGILKLCRRELLPVVLVIPMFVLLYSAYPFFLQHYLVVIIPAMTLLVLLGAQMLPAAAPPPWRATLGTLGSLLIAALSISALPEFRRHAADFPLHYPVQQHANAVLAGLPREPAVVLFRWADGQEPQDEPVYNSNVAWPDDAPIIRAHDLGDRNFEIFNYYAKLQPDRRFYLYDRATGTLTDLGLARQRGNAN